MVVGNTRTKRKTEIEEWNGMDVFEMGKGREYMNGRKVVLLLWF